MTEKRKRRRKVNRDEYDVYRAYRLIRVSDPYEPYIKGKNRGMVEGKCRLELLAEAVDVEELWRRYPLRRTYYETGDKVVQPFVVDKEYVFYGMHVRTDNLSICYHTNGFAAVKGEYAFEMIYGTFNRDNIFVIQTWNLLQIREIYLLLENTKDKNRSHSYRILVTE